jgi:hypothetical protein
VEVEIDFAPHPGFAGCLPMFVPACEHMEALQDSGVLDDFAVVFGASNVLHVLVERRHSAAHGVSRRGGSGTRKRRAAGSAGKNGAAGKGRLRARASKAGR